MKKQDATYAVRVRTVPTVQKNTPIILNGWIPTRMPHTHTNNTAKPPTGLINFVDVNTISKPSNNDNRSHTETQNKSKDICTECILHEAKMSGLKIKNDQVRQQFIELEKENKMLKLQLNMHVSPSTETNDDISMESNEKCKICLVTLTKHELSTHTCITLDELKCEYCLLPFKSINDLCDHFSDSFIHNNEKSYQCNKCTQKFLAAVLLKCHENVVHPHLNSKLFQCGKCNESFEQGKELKQHLNKAHPETNFAPQWLNRGYDPAITCFECYICKIQMNQMADLKNHIKQHAYNREKCKICNKYLVSNAAMQYHICDTEKQSVKCEYCDSTFQAISQLLTHLECEHPNRIMYRCRKCPKFFAMKQLVDLHEKCHSEEVEKPFACDQCRHRFGDKQRLDRHMQTHTTERNFICAECGKSYKTANSLKMHSSVHSDAVLQCADCPAKFKNRMRLTIHRKVHENVKYKCSQCNSTFSLKSCLWKHARRAHGLILKKFHCTLCSYKFAERKGLQKHMRTHTGEKSFECKFCDKKYAHKGDLTKHLQVHVGDNVYTCEQCGMGFRLFVDLRKHTFEHYKQDKQRSDEHGEASTSKAQ